VGPAYRVGVTAIDLKSDLVEHLETLNRAVLGKLDGLSEYDLRRPMTPTSTNLLGVVKHLASVQAGYFGETFGRPFPRNDEMTWRTDPNADPQDDLWVKPDESTEWVTGLYRATWEHALETFADRDLDAPGAVPWWSDSDVTLGQILVHMLDETARHAGHIDIVRELIDGSVGRYAADRNIADGYDWATYRDRVEAGAVAAQEAAGS
jgi:uncharacterized damage-inducible protein DinB